MLRCFFTWCCPSWFRWLTVPACLDLITCVKETVKVVSEERVWRPRLGVTSASSLGRAWLPRQISSSLWRRVTYSTYQRFRSMRVSPCLTPTGTRLCHSRISLLWVFISHWIRLCTGWWRRSTYIFISLLFLPRASWSSRCCYGCSVVPELDAILQLYLMH